MSGFPVGKASVWYYHHPKFDFTVHQPIRALGHRLILNLLQVQDVLKLVIIQYPFKLNPIDIQIDQFRYIKIHTWLQGLGE